MKAIPYLILALAVPVWLNAFSVNPMVAEFDPNTARSQQVFVLSNTSGSEKPIEISVAKPMLDENGVETMELGNGEDEFLIIPQQFVLPPNSRRSVKVFYVGEPREQEDTYRIIFKELPVELAQEELPEGESSFSMRVVMQYNTRVWLTPKGLEEDLAVTGFEKILMPMPKTVTKPTEENAEGSADTPEIPMLQFTIANAGLAHGYLRYPKIALVTKQGKRIQLSKHSLRFVSGQVIHKQSEKEFKVEWLDEFPEIAEIDRIELVTERR